MTIKTKDNYDDVGDYVDDFDDNSEDRLVQQLRWMTIQKKRRIDDNDDDNGVDDDVDIMGSKVTYDSTEYRPYMYLADNCGDGYEPQF